MEPLTAEEREAVSRVLDHTPKPDQFICKPVYIPEELKAGNLSTCYRTDCPGRGQDPDGEGCNVNYCLKGDYPVDAVFKLASVGEEDSDYSR